MDEGLKPEELADLPIEKLEVIDPRRLLSFPERAFHRFMVVLHTFPAVEKAFFGVRRSWVIWVLLALLSVATDDYVEHWTTMLVAGKR
ncbi:hypothetical protein NE235_35835 [Actinoallomurus spadix]|uniref:Transposase n=1 Tax=Actinoallomurus spadix TaxID=79912 RepID=A0ABP3GD39_9ACTN|nr:hypothetical protein [Actinoallomurus spadix]MCO5991500.1 hypothetical protein [Actinoallomurus spadix]